MHRRGRSNVKIIANTGKDGYLVEATSRELTRLTGYTNTTARDAPILRIGSTINVDDMFLQLHAIAGMEKKLGLVRFHLTTMVEDLAQVVPVINEIETASKLLEV